MPVPFDDDFAEYPDSPNKAVALPRPAPPANVISATVAPLLIAYNVCFSVALSGFAPLNVTSKSSPLSFNIFSISSSVYSFPAARFNVYSPAVIAPSARAWLAALVTVTLSCPSFAVNAILIFVPFNS